MVLLRRLAWGSPGPLRSIIIVDQGHGYEKGRVSLLEIRPLLGEQVAQQVCVWLSGWLLLTCRAGEDAHGEGVVADKAGQRVPRLLGVGSLARQLPTSQLEVV